MSSSWNPSSTSSAGRPRRQGIRTDLWGSGAWNFLHAITFAYPETDPTPQEQESAKNLFRALRDLLPCPQCAPHYCEGFDVEPVDQFVGSREDLARWLVRFHNKVNARLGKPAVSYETVRDRYLGSDAVCPASAIWNNKPGCSVGSSVSSSSSNYSSSDSGVVVWSLVASALLVAVILAMVAWSSTRARTMALRA